MVPLGRLVLPRFSLQLEFLHQRFCDREKKQRKFVGYLVVVVRACVNRGNRGNTGIRCCVPRLSGGGRKKRGRGVDRDADLGVEIRRGVNANDETER